jgi:predicted DNA-binding transcriptional regulator YafY
MPKFHRRSVFGPGPRRPLDREQRARFKFLATAHRAARHLTADHLDVAEALLRRLGVDGRCDPSRATLAADTGACERTVRRALDRLRTLGLVSWHQRIDRAGWRVVQTSNAYLLMPTAQPNPAPVLAAQKVKSSLGVSRSACPSVAAADRPPPSLAEIAAARAALARRQAAVEAQLMAAAAEERAAARLGALMGP